MQIIRFGAGLAALVLGVQVLAAQQPGRPQSPDRRAGGMMGGPGMQQQMRMMDSLNARLDTLVSRMTRATGERKVTAMADVINELVAQRKGMQQHMRQMMEHRQGMMHDTGAPAPGEGRHPTSGRDSAAADTGH